jgi:hypothetical protein
MDMDHDDREHDPPHGPGDDDALPVSRRALLGLLSAVGGSAALLQALNVGATGVPRPATRSPSRPADAGAGIDGGTRSDAGTPPTHGSPPLTGAESPVINAKALPYGAVGDGVHDDTEALQRAFDAIGTAAGSVVVIPPGTYRVSRSLRVTRKEGFVVRGGGPGATRLLWRGPQDQVLLRVEACYGGTIEQLMLLCVPDFRPPPLPRVEYPCNAAILTSGGGASADVHFVKVHVMGYMGPAGPSGNSRFTHGVRFTADVGGDANNDRMTFTDCIFEGFVERGVSVEHTQSVGHRFFGCMLRGGAIGIYGNSYYFYGGMMGGQTDANFVVTPLGATPTVISGVNIESSARLLRTEHFSNYVTPVIVEGVRWSTPDVVPNARQAVIEFFHVGPLVLLANSFYWIDPRTRARITPKIVHAVPGPAVPQLVAIGNAVVTGPVPEEPFVTSAGPVGVTLLGNVLYIDAARTEPLPNRLEGPAMSARVGRLGVEQAPAFGTAGTGTLRARSAFCRDERVGARSHVMVTLNAPSRCVVQSVVPQVSPPGFTVHLSADPERPLPFSYLIVERG